MKARYVTLDTETGGFNEHEHCLLKGCFVILTKDLEEVARLRFDLERDPMLTCTEEALRINKIDLVEHDRVALPKLRITQDLVSFFTGVLGEAPTKEEKLRPTGQNPWFDLRFLKAQLPQVPWDTFFHYHVLDTASVTEALVIAGKYPDNASGSLAPVAEYFGIDASQAHSEVGDVEMVIKLLHLYKNHLYLLAGIELINTVGALESLNADKSR